MKTTLKTALTVTGRLIKRAALWIQIRALETTMAGRQQLFPLVTDRITLASMDNLQCIAACELRRLKRAYLA
jgi:hypothetical protein